MLAMVEARGDSPALTLVYWHLVEMQDDLRKKQSEPMPINGEAVAAGVTS